MRTRSARTAAWLTVGMLTVAGCAPAASGPDRDATPSTIVRSEPRGPGGMGPGMDRGMGPGMGMGGRHMTPVPDEYAGVEGPPDADAERGRAIYEASCASCHGTTGSGDGPAAAALDPPPAPVAMTAPRLPDDYLFWRIAEGGAPFGTQMPAWKDALDDRQIWDVIAYLRAMA